MPRLTERKILAILTSAAEGTLGQLTASPSADGEVRREARRSNNTVNREQRLSASDLADRSERNHQNLKISKKKKMISLGKGFGT